MIYRNDKMTTYEDTLENVLDAVESYLRRPEIKMGRNAAWDTLTMRSENHDAALSGIPIHREFDTDSVELAKAAREQGREVNKRSDSWGGGYQIVFGVRVVGTAKDGQIVHS